MGFNFTELEADERIVFGPVTTTKTTTIGGSSDLGQGGVSHTSGHTVGVTTHRVIVEDLRSPERTQVIPNTDVQQVFIKRRQRNGQPYLNLTKVQTAGGQVLKLNLQNLPAQAENLFGEVFPNAEVVESKGGVGSKILMGIAILIGLAIFFLCILPMVGGIIAKIFGG